ncbi:hypothetical protein D3C74_411340 [compost metagenome]
MNRMELVRFSIDDHGFVLFQHIAYIDIRFNQQFHHFVRRFAFQANNRCRLEHIGY